MKQINHIDNHLSLVYNLHIDEYLYKEGDAI
jgi:hypothetical protein